MALRIVKSREPIQPQDPIILLLGQPGGGKTTLAQTANKTLLLDFDRGVHRAKIRGDVVQIESWADVAGMSADDLAAYDTVIIDTVGRMVESAITFMIAENPKLGAAGVPNQAGWQRLKIMVSGWLKSLRGYNKTVILIAHSKEEKHGDETVERMDIQGGTREAIYQLADSIGRIFIKNGKRTLSFDISDTSFGKNPAEIPAQEIPNAVEVPDFMAKIIQQIKDHAGKLTAEQAEMVEALAPWKSAIANADDAEKINNLIEEAKTASELVRDNVKRMIAAKAKQLSLTFDKDAKVYK